MARILIFAGYGPSLVNFRGPLIRRLVEAGFEVIACAPGRDAQTEARLRQLGATYEPLMLERAGMNPAADLWGIVHLYRLLMRLRPDLVLSYTIKPVIYGSLAAWLARVPRICSIITGLGYSFTTASLLNRIVRQLYRAALQRNDVVFFQNRDDEEEFRRVGILPGYRARHAGYRADSPGYQLLEEGYQTDEIAGREGERVSGGTRSVACKPRTVVVSGSGVDLEHFAATPLRVRRKETVEVGAATAAERISTSTCDLNFLLIARLLRDKGTVEFAAAARELKRKYPDCRFQLLGPHDPNPAALRPEEVQAWVDEGSIEYLGEAEDVRPFLQACDVYVLPSYREGTPRTVLEAMAVGRAIITTDAPGCRETIRGANGDRLLGRELLGGEGKRRQWISEAVGSRAENADNGIHGEGRASTSTRPASTSTRPASTGTPVRGENGFLVPVRDAESLAWAMEHFILNPELCAQMGRASREYAEARFDVHKVNAVILKEMGALLRSQLK